MSVEGRKFNLTVIVTETSESEYGPCDRTGSVKLAMSVVSKLCSPPFCVHSLLHL